MKKQIGIGAALGTFALVGLAGYGFLQPPAEASAPIEAVALAQTSPVAASVATVYEIQTTDSQARFVIDEILLGQPKTVVGTTNQVAGQIALDPAALNTAQVGKILINARTFATDDSMRDRTIANQVLQTSQYEYISFTPTGLLNAAGTSTGESVLQLNGDLKIRGVSRPVTFDITLTELSGSSVTGTASTSIDYAAWNISIPQSGKVAGVADQVRLELDFRAAAAA